jgi:SagB-type dehydrogenase family enzyme
MAQPQVTRRKLLRAKLFIPLIIGGGALAATLAILTEKPINNDVRERQTRTNLSTIKLPPPRLDGPISLEQAILRRRSRREYTDRPLKLSDVSQLLWAAQGITEPKVWVGLRSAPSAGGLYPLELYVAVKKGGVQELEPGIYHYKPREHELELIIKGDFSRQLMAACVDQEWVRDAAINIIFTAVVERTKKRYGERGWQYILQESGHAAQNVYLQAEALGLGCVVIGAFYESEIEKILDLPRGEIPVYVMPVGSLE